MMPLTLAGDDPAFLIVGAAGAAVVGCLWVLLEMIKVRARERTKREIAAYIAEGTITPEDGAKLMQAASLDPADVDAAKRA